MSRATEISELVEGYMTDEKFFDFMNVPEPAHDAVDALHDAARKHPRGIKSKEAKQYVFWAEHAFVGELQTARDSLEKNRNRSDVDDWKLKIVNLTLKSKNR